MTLHPRDLRDTASLRYRNRAENHRSYVRTEAQSRMVSCRRESYPVLTTGTPNNGFLLNTFKTLFRLSRVVLDLFRRYEIFIRPLILGELD